MRIRRFPALAQQGHFLPRFHHPFFKGIQWLAVVAMILQPIPLSRADGPSNTDTDGDGIPDWWETQYGLNPNDPTDAFKDLDGDRVPNLWEYLRGTDPTDPNSAPAPDAVVDGSQATDATQNRYATLQEAYDALPAYQADGVTPYYGFIEVKAGTYTSGVDGSQTPKKVLWQADVGGQVVIQNSGPAMVIADEAVVDGFTIQGDGQTPGPGIVVQPTAGFPEVRVVNTIISGRDSDSSNPVGGVLNDGGNLWLVQDTLVANQGTSADAVLNAAGSLTLVNSIVGDQGSGNAAQSVVDQQNGGGVIVQSSIITGMGGAWGSMDANPQLTDTGGHLTASSSACFGQGVNGAGDVVDLYGQVRPQGSPTPDLGAEQWVDSIGNGVPDWYESQLVRAGLASNFWQLQPGVDYNGDGRNLTQDFQMGVRPQSSGVSYTLALSADQSTLSPGGTATLTAQLTATSGGTSHGVNGALVNFNVVSGDGSLSGSNFYTDGNGQCLVTFTAGQSSSEVTVSDLSGLGTSQGCSFTVNGSTGDSHSLSVSADNEQLSPGQTANLYVQLSDSVSGPVSGATVNFSVVSGDGSLSMVSVITDSMGNATTTFTAGNSNCQVNIWDGNGFGTSTNYNFAVWGTGGTQDSYNLAMWADNNVLQPGQTSNLYAYLYDSTTGSPISGALITFGTQFGDGSLGSSSTMTDGGGMVTITFTGGYNSTQVNAADSSGYNTSNSYTFGVDTSGIVGGGDSPPAPDTYMLNMWADSNPLDPGDQTNLYAQLVDTTQGAVISGASISFSQPYGDGSLGSYSVTTDANGIAAVSFVGGFNVSQVNAADQNGYGTANSYTFTVTDPGGGGGTPPSDNYSLALWADQSTLSPGQSTSFFAQMTDNGTPMAGITLNLATASGDGSFSVTSGTTDSNGTLDISYISGSSQTQVNVWDGNGYGAFNSYTFGVVTISPGDSFSLSLWSDNNPVAAGFGSNLYAQFMDTTQRAPVTGATLIFTVTSGDGQMNVTSSATDGTGNCVVGFTGGQSETVVTVADNNGYGASQTYTFEVLPVNPLQPPPPDTYAINLSADLNPLGASTSTALRAQVVDVTQNNAPVSGVTLNFSVGSGTGLLGDSSLTTGGDGTCSMTFTGSDSPTVINVSDASGLNASNTYTVQVASQTNPPPVTYALSVWADNPSPPPDVTTTFYSCLTEQTSPGADPVPVEGATLVLTKQSGGGTLGPTSLTTLANGVASTSFLGGTMPTQINVADANGYGASQSFTFTVGQRYSLALVGNPFTAMNTGDMGTLAAVFYDNSTQSPVSDLSVTFSVLSGGGTLDNGGSTETVTTLSDGSCSVGFTMGSSDTEISVADSNGYASSAYTFTNSADGSGGGGGGGGGGGDCGCSQAGCPGSSCIGAGDPGSCTCQSSSIGPCMCSNFGNGCNCSNAQGCIYGSCVTGCASPCMGNNCQCKGSTQCGGGPDSLLCTQTQCATQCGCSTPACMCGLQPGQSQCKCGCGLQCCPCNSSGACMVQICRDGVALDPNGEDPQELQALIGQQIKLSLTNAGVSNIQWSISGWNFKDYKGKDLNGNDTTDLTHAVNQAKVTPLDPVADLQSDELNFFWSQAGPQKISVSFSLGNCPSWSTSATINVQAPTCDFTVVKMGTVRGDTAKVFLENGDPSSGISTSLNVGSVPSSFGAQGKWMMVQILSQQSYYIDSSGNRYVPAYNRGLTNTPRWLIDTTRTATPPVPYPFWDTWTSRDTGWGSEICTDHPGTFYSDMTNGVTRSRHDQFLLYVMFQPPPGDSSTRWVPLKMMSWQWGFDSTKTNGTWTMTPWSAAVTSIDPSSGQPGSVPAYSPPQWSGNDIDYSWVDDPTD